MDFTSFMKQMDLDLGALKSQQANSNLKLTKKEFDEIEQKTRNIRELIATLKTVPVLFLNLRQFEFSSKTKERIVLTLTFVEPTGNIRFIPKEIFTYTSRDIPESKYGIQIVSFRDIPTTTCNYCKTKNSAYLTRTDYLIPPRVSMSFKPQGIIGMSTDDLCASGYRLQKVIKTLCFNCYTHDSNQPQKTDKKSLIENLAKNMMNLGQGIEPDNVSSIDIGYPQKWENESILRYLSAF